MVFQTTPALNRQSGTFIPASGFDRMNHLRCLNLLRYGVSGQIKGRLKTLFSRFSDDLL
ncbi:hypothetical protein HMPREF1051_2696 [Neisseria sicca VK64]|uniref:Uncharacterized protein n=1 Tax=Neisseria sicca VK64 TaxID=1095748 RepID=I2NWC3_NEISI|nr:hypothetical protein HMPREF1051_2696 [Neisseria sicca VK64]